MIWTRGRAFWPSSLTEFHPDSKSWEPLPVIRLKQSVTVLQLLFDNHSNLFSWNKQLKWAWVEIIPYKLLLATKFKPFFNQAVGHNKHWRFLYYVNFGILEYRAPYDVSRVHRWQRNSISYRIRGRAKGHTMQFLVFRKWSKKCSGSLTKCLINENKPDDDQHYIKTKSSTKWTLWKRRGFKLHSLW
jgi:hypothetical protein